MRILVVEDEEALADAISYVLEKQGYQVDVVYDGEDGECYAMEGIYDALVLDRMLPGRDGLTLLRNVRNKRVETPAMFLTAMDTVDNRVEGLEVGADDYLVKPFANKELVARVKALLRRREAKIRKESVEVGTGKLEVCRNLLTTPKGKIELSATEAQLLEYLAVNKGQVLSKNQILDKIWGFDKDVSAANVELYMFYLRKKVDFKTLGLELKTLWGRGYSLTDALDR